MPDKPTHEELENRIQGLLDEIGQLKTNAIPAGLTSEGVAKYEQSLQALKESEEKYRDLTENIQEVIYRLDTGP